MILKLFLNRTDFEREVFCGPSKNILQIVFDMVQKAMDNYYTGGASCSNQLGTKDQSFKYFFACRGS